MHGVQRRPETVVGLLDLLRSIWRARTTVDPMISRIEVQHKLSVSIDDGLILMRVPKVEA